MDTDPSTGRPLDADAIQRVLFVSPSVNVYHPPPLTSTKGYNASTWTEDPKRLIFTARIRVIETAVPKKPVSETSGENISCAIVMEDPSSGELYAAAPYNVAGVVEQVLDSSRFFAVRVQAPGGQKAVLGIGFSERSEAFDFSVTLQEVRKTLGLEPGASGGRRPAAKEKEALKRDFSLKEGETITVNIGGIKSKGRRSGASETARTDGSGAGFSLPPPPGGGLLPPPPSAQEVKAQKRLSQTLTKPEPDSIEDMGFDDGEFGEFQ